MIGRCWMLIGLWPDAKLCVKSKLVTIVTWWQCPAWHGSDSAWHGVTESVTQPSVRLSPPFRLLLSSPHYRWHNMQLCKTLRKVFCNRVEIFKCCAIFKVQSLWGFPQFPGSSPALLESAAHGRGDEMSQWRGIQYWRLTLYTYFTPSQNVSNSRVLLRAPRPAQAQHAHHPVTSKHSLSPALFHIGDIIET